MRVRTRTDQLEVFLSIFQIHRSLVRRMFWMIDLQPVYHLTMPIMLCIIDQHDAVACLVLFHDLEGSVYLRHWHQFNHRFDVMILGK